MKRNLLLIEILCYRIPPWPRLFDANAGGGPAAPAQPGFRAIGPSGGRKIRAIWHGAGEYHRVFIPEA